MLYLLISVLLFGLVHPMSKVILDTGIPLSFFCLLYISIRLVIQAPLVVCRKAYKLNYKQVFLLFCLGSFGAGIQYFEFKGISRGVSPGMVTFLVFSYPIWIVLAQIFYSKNTKSIFIDFLKVTIGIIGVYLISRDEVDSLENLKVTNLMFPVIAGVFMAAWIGLSNYLSKKGSDAFSLSFYCDVFSLVVLIVTLNGNLIGDWAVTLNWLFNFKHILLIVFYSLFIGLIPNLLFYMANKKVSVLAVGITMTLEPVLSVLYSSFLWKTDLSWFFVLGALLIVVTNLSIINKKI